MSTADTNIKQDHFQLNELFLLAKTTIGEHLFGLPDEKAYGFLDKGYMEKAHKALKEKGVLTKEGKLTDGGFFVVRALEEYKRSSKYIRINNLMIAFSEREKGKVIVLTEVRRNTDYRLTVMDHLALFKELYDSLEIVSREPRSDEKEFLYRMVKNNEQKRLEQKKLSEETLIFQDFDRAVAVEKQIDSYQHWVFFIEEETLYGLNVREEGICRISQYWLIEKLMTALELPLFKQETEEKQDEQD